MERQAWQVFGPRLKNIAWPSTTNTNSSSSSSSSGGSGGGLNTFPPTFPTLASSATASASSVPSAATSSALAAQQPARPPLLIKSWTCADTLHLLVSDLTQCWGCTLRAGPELRKQAGEFNRYVELDQRRLLRLLGSALALTDANAEFTLQAQGATTTPAPAAAVPQLELHLSTRAGPAQFKWIFRCAVQPPHVLFTHLTHPLMAMVADLKHRCRNYQVGGCCVRVFVWRFCVCMSGWQSISIHLSVGLAETCIGPSHHTHNPTEQDARAGGQVLAAGKS